MTSNENADLIPLQTRLLELESRGVKLYLNGVPSNTDYIVANCVKEDAVYMPDYIADEEGRIKEVRYDRIF